MVVGFLRGCVGKRRTGKELYYNYSKSDSFALFYERKTRWIGALDLILRWDVDVDFDIGVKPYVIDELVPIYERVRILGMVCFHPSHWLLRSASVVVSGRRLF